MKTQPKPKSTSAVRLDARRLRQFRDGRYRSVREQVRRQARELAIFQPRYGLSLEEARARTWEQLEALRDTGGAGRMFPKKYGGQGNVGGSITAFEMLGHADLALLVKAGVQWGLFGGAIHHLGTERHLREYVPKVISLELPGCFAMTETGHGSDVQSVRTTATYDPKRRDFVIDTPDDDARKDYIGNAARDGRMAAVFAQLITQGESHGVHCFLVPIRDGRGRPARGVTIEDCGYKGGLNGVDNGRLAFDHVRVPREALLDRFAGVAPDGTYSSPIENPNRRFFTMLGTLIQGRVSVSGAALRATETALAIAVRYGLVRRQFHPPGTDGEVILLDYLEHQRRLLVPLATAYALHFAQQDLVSFLHDVFSASDEDDDRRRHLEAMAAGLKATNTWFATRTIQTCREACGGAGYMAVNRITQIRADADIFTTFEGDNTVLLQLVARGLLTNYAQEFGSLDTLGMVRFVADTVVQSVIERAAARPLIQGLVDAVPGLSPEADLRDRKAQLQLFEWREQHILGGVARRLKKGLDQSGDAFAAFNQCQDHVLLAAQSHVDTLVLRSFAAAIERCEDEGLRELLGKVCDLHVLALIERERGWFQEHGQLSSTRSKAVIGMVNQLCDELRPYAELLVDAFGIPDEVLAAPIATGDELDRQRAKGQAR
ncbi:MAG TPA: acyl-CoA dehydrogenase [Candidatus Dormibacteraeota bacterium]